MVTTAFPDTEVKVHRLGNGLTVLMERLPYLRSVSAGLWIGAGSAQERAYENGLAHFLEHLFFKGTETRNVHQIMEAVEGRGGHLNAFTTREHTCLYVKMLDEHIHTGIEILADLVKHPTFQDLEKERNVILEEIAAVEDSPDEYIHDQLTEFHWPDHPLGRPVSGHASSVAQLNLTHNKEFYQRWYQPENLYFSIAGNFDEAQVLDQLDAEFSSLPSAPIPERDGAPDFHSGTKMITRDIAQCQISLAFPGPSMLDENRYIANLTSSMLGGSSTSRLFERVREDEGLAYSIFSYESFHRTTGTVGVCAGISPQVFRRTMELITEEIRKFRDEPVTEQELNTNREQIKGGMLMALESTSARMTRMAKSMMAFDRVVPIEEVITRVDTVTCDEISAFARKTYQQDNLALAVLGPEGEYSLEGISL